jgi:hypothetical protein
MENLEKLQSAIKTIDVSGKRPLIGVLILSEATHTHFTRNNDRRAEAVDICADALEVAYAHYKSRPSKKATNVLSKAA